MDDELLPDLEHLTGAHVCILLIDILGDEFLV
jgi:hypothetical protein